jgi:hypothetical protein
MVAHPQIAQFLHTPFPYLILTLFTLISLGAERRLKEPRLVARYVNSRTIPDLHSATMQMWFDTEHKKPGWDEHRFNWDWFIEAQIVNDSDTPTTVDSLQVTVSIKPIESRII